MGRREEEEAKVEERERKSKELGIGKDLPMPPSQKMDESWSDY